MSAASFRSLMPRLLGISLLLSAALSPAPCRADETDTDHTPSAEAPEGGDSGQGGHDGHEVDTSQPPGWQTDLALWSLVTFVLFLWVLRRFAWGPLISGLDQREEGIRQSIAEAEESRRKAQALLADYEAKLRGAEQTVAEMVAEAKRDAERTSQDILAKAQTEVQAMQQRAKHDITQAKDAALAEVFSSVNRQVALATEHVLGRALSDEDQNRLIGEALQEVTR